jgi:predicted TIM-barrel fold metal-dependent hydrolase
MSTVFDAHGHLFPPLAEDRGFTKARLAEHQYHVRFHRQGIRRTRDDARISEPLLLGERDGITWLPDVDFRIGKFGRVEFTHEDEDYYIQWMSPVLQDMSSPPELVVRQMDYAGVDRAVIQHDRVYGHLDDFLAECLRQYPDRFTILAQVDEWIGGQPDQLTRLRHEVEDLGFSGLYFSTGGFLHDDFKSNINDAALEPLWKLVEELGVPIHWYAARLKRDQMATYMAELAEMTEWATNHPGIPSVLTHGLNNISTNMGKPDRFTVLPEMVALLQKPGWHVELMLHLMYADAEFPPYAPELETVMETLVNEVGADRLLWGSDSPACDRTLTCKQSMLLFQTRCPFLTDEQRAAILGENLARLYPAS